MAQGASTLFVQPPPVPHKIPPNLKGSAPHKVPPVPPKAEEVVNLEDPKAAAPEPSQPSQPSEPSQPAKPKPQPKPKGPPECLREQWEEAQQRQAAEAAAASGAVVAAKSAASSAEEVPPYTVPDSYQVTQRRGDASSAVLKACFRWKSSVCASIFTTC